MQNKKMIINKFNYICTVNLSFLHLVSEQVFC